ncbi:alcohol dehydrogenase [Burkholderia singularis]|uniref:Alcohol dehydrogenase n=1 Tax=Burkholderia singularis TaxID=1503053 RepID=A0A118DPR6_9BURK|nr:MULTISPECIES: iron-containing alcohol dehydrogenase [Burkholderia]AOK31505.1 alcohol dehydrogenase [Burkholderia sp. Bp7605]KVE28656.1 alcohol dehydrogenase [Burkholderia singularis]
MTYQEVPCIDWHYPTAIKVGPGRIRETPHWCLQHGITRPLLVTDPFIAKQPYTGTLIERFRAAGIDVQLFDQIKGNPTGGNVAAGLDVYRRSERNGVVALGGGSPIDAAKAIALMTGQTGQLWDYEDVGNPEATINAAGIAPMIAIPTTAGTGSETGRAAVITDEQARVKRTMLHLKMMPRVAILDAELTLGLPPGLTAATGMDALTHCLEAWCSPVYHPMAEGIAAEGMRLIRHALPAVLSDGNDVHARQQMLVASALGAASFQRGLGAVHAMAQTLGALYDAHHGLLNAVLLPYVLRANAAMPQEPLERLARYLDLPGTGLEAILQWVLTLRREGGIPHTLRTLGIDGSQTDLICRMAVADGCSNTNPVAVSTDYYRRLLDCALDGVL